MVELLLLSNADPNLRAVKNERVQAALMFASYATNKIGVVTPLLERGRIGSKRALNQVA